jgi:hypothetical protein
MLFFGYVGKDDNVYLTAYCSMFEVNQLARQPFVKKMINTFEAQNYEQAKSKAELCQIF